MTALVLELQRAAMGDESISSVLRKAVAVASKLSVGDMDTWLSYERDGYPPEVEVPDYRIVEAPVRAHNPYHGLIPIMVEETGRQQSRELPIRHPVARLEHLVEGEGQLHSPLGVVKDGIVTLPTSAILGQDSLHAILDRIRNIVLDWSLSLEKHGVLGDGLTFTDKERSAARQIQHVTNFYGAVGRAIVQQGSPGADATMQVQLASVHSLVEQVQASLSDLEPESQGPASTALAKVKEEAGAESPKRARMVKWLKGLGESLKAGKAGADLVEAVYKLIQFLG